MGSTIWITCRRLPVMKAVAALAARITQKVVYGQEGKERKSKPLSSRVPAISSDGARLTDARAPGVLVLYVEGCVADAQLGVELVQLQILDALLVVEDFGAALDGRLAVGCQEGIPYL